MILSIDLGGTNVRLGQIKNGRIIKEKSLPSPSCLSLEDSLNYLKVAICEMLTEDTQAIGIGVPSVVDASQGIVYNAMNIPSWKKVHLKKNLSNEFNLPVYVNNDCNCFVLGEKKYGIGKSYKDIVGVTLGTGVGAGVIIDNKLYCGHNTGAGEIGSLSYLDENFEHYCSSVFFSTYYHTTAEDLAQKAYMGDLPSNEVWRKFGMHMGNLIQAILYVYDPEIIILGGGISKAYSLFEDEMRKMMNQFPYPETVKNVEIKVSNNKDISLLGASALIDIN